jgi:hypothetical protein
MESNGGLGVLSGRFLSQIESNSGLGAGILDRMQLGFCVVRSSGSVCPGPRPEPPLPGPRAAWVAWSAEGRER